MSLTIGRQDMRLAAGQEPAREKWGVGRAVQQQTAAKNGYYIVYLFTIGLFLGILIVNLGYDTWIGEGSQIGRASCRERV